MVAEAGLDRGNAEAMLNSDEGLDAIKEVGETIETKGKIAAKP